MIEGLVSIRSWNERDGVLKPLRGRSKTVPYHQGGERGILSVLQNAMEDRFPSATVRLVV
jgi:hypothetical protein